MCKRKLAERERKACGGCGPVMRICSAKAGRDRSFKNFIRRYKVTLCRKRNSPPFLTLLVNFHYHSWRTTTRFSTGVTKTMNTMKPSETLLSTVINETQSMQRIPFLSATRTKINKNTFLIDMKVKMVIHLTPESPSSAFQTRKKP